MQTLRRIAYWIAVVAVSAVLAYLLIRLAEGLDASQIEGALIGVGRRRRTVDSGPDTV